MGTMNKIRRLELFLKHAKKFVSKDVSRPIFECACIREGNGYATNTHVMLVVNDVWEKRKNDLLYNMHTKELVEQTKFIDKQSIEKITPKIETSPVVINVLKKDEQNVNPLLPLSMWMKSSIAIIKKVDRWKSPILKTSFTETSILFSFETKEVKTECSFEFKPETASYLYKEWEQAKDLAIHFNGVLFLSALEALLEFDCKEINFAFTGPLTPFALYGDKDITAVITPMRVG